MNETFEQIQKLLVAFGVLNHPAGGIAWLARRLRQYGMEIAAGHVVLSGSFVRPIEARPGDAIVLRPGI